MTKQDAIQAVAQGYSVEHPEGGWIEEVVEVISFAPRREVRALRFHGDCSPKEGWQAEWLGER